MKFFFRIFFILTPFFSAAQLQWTHPDSSYIFYSETRDTLLRLSHVQITGNIRNPRYQFYDSDGILIKDSIDQNYYSMNPARRTDGYFIAKGTVTGGSIVSKILVFKPDGQVQLEYLPDTAFSVHDITLMNDTIYLLGADSVQKVKTLNISGTQLGEFIVDTSAIPFITSFKGAFVHVKNSRIYVCYGWPVNAAFCFDFSGNQIWTYNTTPGEPYDLCISNDNKVAIVSGIDISQNQWPHWKPYVTLLNSSGQLLWNQNFSTFYFPDFFGDAFFLRDSLYADFPINRMVSVDTSDGSREHSVDPGSSYFGYAHNDSTILMVTVTTSNYLISDITNGSVMPVWQKSYPGIANLSAKFLVPKAWGFYFANDIEFGKYEYTATSVNEPVGKLNTYPYPNPSNGLIYLRIPDQNAIVQAFDLQGKRIDISVFNTPDKKMIRFEDGFEGIAMLKVHSEARSMQYKIVIYK